MNQKVSLIGCNEYDYTQVKNSIANSFENIGGIEKYIDKGDRVLLKINLLMKKRPEEVTTTHPVFVKALADILIAYGAKVLIGDSPGGPFNERALNSIYRVCGITGVAEESGAELNFNTNEMEVKNPKGFILKKLTVTQMLEQVDKVISVSKLKTHGMAVFTGAVKNMFGIVPGILKAEYHFKMPDIDGFADALIDICLCGNPILAFMDGIIGMEGEGPSAGTPRKVGVVLASPSPYHLDVVATSIIGLKPTAVPTIRRSAARGLCSGTLEDIDVIGDSLKKYIIKDYKIPETRTLDLMGGKIPRPIRNLVNSCVQPKPVFDHTGCIGCEICAKNCPAKVITMIDKKPIVDLDQCIRCFCCQELCPKKTIDIHRPWLMRKLSKL